MKLNNLHWTLVAMIVGVVALAGCSSKKSESGSPAASSQAEPSLAAPSGTSETEKAGATITPAATVAGIWTQIGDEQGKLSAAIQNGQLKDVHHLAFGIHDLVVAVVGKVNAASPAGAAHLNGMVEKVKASAGKLDELGDAGNLSGTQAEYATLVTLLDSVKTMSGGK